MATASGSTQKEIFENTLKDLKRLQRALHTATVYMMSETRHEPVVVFGGNSKSGKSCVINYLMGNKLKGELLPNKKRHKVVLKKADDSDGPKIGIEAKSETAIPSRWESIILQDLAIWDLPGFWDNRGIFQDITNGFYINELFKNVMSAKIILVCDFNDISSDGITQFISLVSSVEKLLGNQMKDCIPSIGLVVTKVPEVFDEVKVDKEMITQFLSDQFLTCPEIAISKFGRDLIKFWIENEKNIGLFMKVKLGEVQGLSIDFGVTDVILNVECIPNDVLKNFSPSISYESKVFLYSTREHLVSMKTFNELQNVLENIHDKLVSELDILMASDNVTAEDLIPYITNVSITAEKIRQVLKSDVSFQEKIKSLQTMGSLINELIKDHNLIERAQLMEFVDLVLDMKESSEFNIKLSGTLLSALSKYDKFSIFMKKKSGQLTAKEAESAKMKIMEAYGKEMKKLQEKMDRLKEHNNTMKRKWGPIAKMFATVGSYLDDMTSKFKEMLGIGGTDGQISVAPPDSSCTRTSEDPTQ